MGIKLQRTPLVPAFRLLVSASQSACRQDKKSLAGLNFKASIANDTLLTNQALVDSGETLVSSNGAFELGFFSPSNSSGRYVGIRHKNVPGQVVVWVANKEIPVIDLSGVLTVTAHGNVIIFQNQTTNVIWSSNSSTASINSPILQLLDTGNLVVKRSDSDNFIWQSFDDPSNTLMPGMKLGYWDLKNGLSWYFLSWKSTEDPSTGECSYKLDPRGLPQLKLRKGSKVVFRSLPWVGINFIDDVNMKEIPLYQLIHDSNQLYFTFQNQNDTTIARFVISPLCLLEHFIWYPKYNDWYRSFALPHDGCDGYLGCGPNGICNGNKLVSCQCPDGFVPKDRDEWDQMLYIGGCVRRTPLNCSTNEGFRKFAKIKLPDDSHLMDSIMSAKECQGACLRNCSCMAYATTNFSICVMWFGDLLDLRVFNNDAGQDLYIRMAASDLDGIIKARRTIGIALISTIAAVLVLFVAIWCIMWKRKSDRKIVTWNRSGGRIGSNFETHYHDHNPSFDQKDTELQLYDLSTIAAATNNFSFANKVGEGGFGPVYKGKLCTGKEIAVKTLSKLSGQGLKEFKNEIVLIANLQHRNLVRLLGCCVHEEERMLIYEYMPNRSLDLYIFNQKRGTSLDWQKRFDIIVGIARGLLYLHRDSRLRIIHRDLKASNILLDREMNPKISDFGLAKMLRADQTEAKTTRIMGTYGYMSPEYATDGQFSIKSDVFSFGVLVLEIISGRRNKEFFHQDHDLNLLGHAWKLWNEGRAIDLADPLMEDSNNISEVWTCIQVGLLCVQKHPEERPTMSSVVLMLDSENPLLPQPRKPGYHADRCLLPNRKAPNATTEITITTLLGR